MKFQYLLALVALLGATAMFITPDLVSAQEPSQLVPCGIGAGDAYRECSVCHLVALGQNIMNFFVFASVVVATLLFVNAGVLYVFSPGNPGNISKGHRIFTNTLVGILIILSSWIIIDFVMRQLIDPALLQAPVDPNQPNTPDGPRWGPWNEILCTGGPVGAEPPPLAPTPPIVVGLPSPSASNITEAQARAIINPYVTIWESAPGRTTLAGMQQTTLMGIVALAQQSGIPRDQLIVTGGTEAMHASGEYSHEAGYKVDFEDNAPMNNYIQNNFTRDGSRSGDPRYTSTVNGRSVECVREGTHWDCTFFP
jgi:hypothetical protein